MPSGHAVSETKPSGGVPLAHATALGRDEDRIAGAAGREAAVVQQGEIGRPVRARRRPDVHGRERARCAGTEDLFGAPTEVLHAQHRPGQDVELVAGGSPVIEQPEPGAVRSGDQPRRVPQSVGDHAAERNRVGFERLFGWHAVPRDPKKHAGVVARHVGTRRDSEVADADE